MVPSALAGVGAGARAEQNAGGPGVGDNGRDHTELPSRPRELQDGPEDPPPIPVPLQQSPTHQGQSASLTSACSPAHSCLDLQTTSWARLPPGGLSPGTTRAAEGPPPRGWRPVAFVINGS
ncbi:hypothetical protein AAY473_002742 [Plecturocebus cupreus]